MGEGEGGEGDDSLSSRFWNAISYTVDNKTFGFSFFWNFHEYVLNKQMFEIVYLAGELSRKLL